MPAVMPTSHGRIVLSAFAVASVLLAAAGVAGCKEQAPAEPPAMPVTVSAVLEREVAEWDEFTGRLRAIDTVDVKPRITGHIERVAFREGSDVKKSVAASAPSPRQRQENETHA